MLRPLRTMNTAIKRISARNVHVRLALRGPRDELRNLADTVDGLLERLDSAFDAQKRFVANAAHELRTPLTLEHALLEESLLHRDSDTSSMRSIMGRLLDLSEQQARLLESLLTLAKSRAALITAALWIWPARAGPPPLRALPVTRPHPRGRPPRPRTVHRPRHRHRPRRHDHRERAAAGGLSIEIHFPLMPFAMPR